MTEQGSGNCHQCQTRLEGRGAVGRRDTCPSCGADLRCCRNCAHYDSAYHNQCREPQAERQVDKERGNFCDFFRLGTAAQATRLGAVGTARRDLDALFRKTPPLKKGAGGI